MPSEVLEEEGRAFVSDKSGETKYQESMKSQIDTIQVPGIWWTNSYQNTRRHSICSNMIHTEPWFFCQLLYGVTIQFKLLFKKCEACCFPWTVKPLYKKMEEELKRGIWREKGLGHSSSSLPARRQP